MDLEEIKQCIWKDLVMESWAKELSDHAYTQMLEYVLGVPDFVAENLKEPT